MVEAGDEIEECEGLKSKELDILAIALQGVVLIIFARGNFGFIIENFWLSNIFSQ